MSEFSMPLHVFIEHHKQEFAKYGFVDCPLTTNELVCLWMLDADNDAVYGVGCDVNAGIDFDRAVEVNLCLDVA